MIAAHLPEINLPAGLIGIFHKSLAEALRHMTTDLKTRRTGRLTDVKPTGGLPGFLAADCLFYEEAPHVWLCQTGKI